MEERDYTAYKKSYPIMMMLQEMDEDRQQIIKKSDGIKDDILELIMEKNESKMYNHDRIKETKDKEVENIQEWEHEEL